MNSQSDLILPIQGLRGIAVLLVVLYHLEVSWFSGGFVGVDVFFVISGFIISKLLLKEYSTSGAISLSQFYTRRIRRILPAATTVIVITVIFSRFFLEPLRLVGLSWDAIASSSFWANALFAYRAIDYLDASLPPSPLQHYWSLSVEEQFYLFFPAILIFSLRLSHRNRQIPFIVLTSVGLVSLALAVLLTNRFPVTTFFYLPSRTWQFIAGAIIPLTNWKTGFRKALIQRLSPTIGLAMILLSATAFNEFTSYPGVAALIPTAGAMLLILRSNDSGRVNQIISHPIFVVLGSRSFALYLWHWPVIIFVKSSTQAPLGLADTLFVVAISAFVTEITYRLIENPVRFSHFLTSRSRNSFALAFVLIALGVSSGLVNSAFKPVTLGELRALESSPDRIQSLLESASDRLSLPANLNPPLEQVFSEEPTIYGLGCHDYDSDLPITCEVGNLNSPVRVALFGDSHAAQWFEPLSQIVVQNDWYLLSITRSGCSSLPDLMPMKCQTWYRNAINVLQQKGITTVVTSSLLNMTEYSPEALTTSLAVLRSQLMAIGTFPIFLQDTPRPHEHIPICLSGNVGNITRCNLSRRTSVTDQFRELVRLVFNVKGSVFVPVEQWFCSEDDCPSVVGNTLVYRDDSHISVGYAKLLTPQLEQSIAPSITTGN